MRHILFYLQRSLFLLKNRPLPGAAALLLFTAVIRLAASSWMPYISRDAVQYVNAAARWAERGSYDLFSFPPLPCFLIKVLIQLGLTPDCAGHVYSFVTGLFVPLAAYSLTVKATSNRRLARYTALMLAVHPLLLQFSLEPMRDSAFILLGVLAMTAGMEGLKKQKLLPWLLCAVLTAAAWCCRFEALELAALALIALAAAAFRKQYPFMKAAGHFLIYLFSAILLWFLLTLAAGGKACFKFQYENYILNKWNLLVERWKV
jgi:hypothetical protein